MFLSSLVVDRIHFLMVAGLGVSALFWRSPSRPGDFLTFVAMWASTHGYSLPHDILLFLKVSRVKKKKIGNEKVSQLGGWITHIVVQ